VLPGEELLALLACGRTLLERHQFEDALENFLAALRLSPELAAAQLGRAEALARLGAIQESLAILDSLLAANPSDADALAARALARLRADRLSEAAADAALAIRVDPANAAARASRGLVLLAAGDDAGALDSFEEACRLRPNLGSAHAGRGQALQRSGRIEEALDAHARAFSFGWIEAGALLGIGAIMVQLNRFDNAYAAFREAGRLQPKDWRAAEGIAMTLVALRRFEEAVPALEALGRAAPWVKNLTGHLFHARLNCCDWRDYHATAADIARRVRAGEHADLPWSFLIHSTSPADQLQCARIYMDDKCVHMRSIKRRVRGSGRIRLAYLSADFHGHATSYLAAGLFECHDRSRFETTAISYGPADDGPMRDRLRRAFDRFVEVQDRSDEAIASLIDELGVDIAVDMKGFTTGSRPQLLAYRAAPLQVAFLAYPGTMGCGFVDYVIADRHLIPDCDRPHYSEQVIWMPGCYQVNDAARTDACTPSRSDAGLRDTDFVFCCFNASYKISPDIFAAWMRILADVEGAVLWLLEGCPAAVRNLRAEAERRGIDPSRLVFAPALPAAGHWARIRLADLFLDTLPCNAHTTASDALWAGVPLITITGSTFAGRVATTLLHAVGMPDLCVSSIAQYERLAAELARSPGELAAIRTRLANGRRSSALFDTAGYCRHLESAYREIHARHRRGEPPSSLDVAALEPAGR